MKYLKTFENTNKPRKYTKKFSNGNIHYISYKLNGNLHREDGPAKEWYLNGKNIKSYII